LLLLPLSTVIEYLKDDRMLNCTEYVTDTIKYEICGHIIQKKGATK